LAGLFFVMGAQALQANGITAKLFFLLQDKNLTQKREALLGIQRRVAVWVFVGVELFGFGATFAITQTIAAIEFPVIILLLIPTRIWILPRFFLPEELNLLDAPTAGPFTMQTVGGNYGQALEELEDLSDPRERHEEGSTVLNRKESPPIDSEDVAEQGLGPGFSELAAERQIEGCLRRVEGGVIGGPKARMR
jgi:boron transporter